MSEVKTVRLADLEHDEVSTGGREDRLAQIDDLLASIPALGQLQSLRVRPWSAGTINGLPLYGVIAGNRRLAALKKLAESGGEVQGVKVGPDFPVHVIFADDNDAVAFAGTVAENVQRLPETPVGEIRAFAKMAEKATAKEIASTFGVTEKRVQQRLKLAGLHPDILDAVESGKIKMDAAEAFTLEPDPAKQAAYLKKHSDWQLQAYYIKQQFTQQLVRGDSAIAKIITAAAYKKAGGQVLGDVFDDKAYWISKDIIQQLLDAHWEKQIVAWKEAGWSFVETVDQFVGKDHWKLNSCERLRAANEGDFTDAQKASAGIVYWPDGSRAPEEGIKRYKEQRQAAPVASLNDLPGGLATKLKGDMCAAVSSRVASDPMLALRLLLATLKENAGYYGQQAPLDLLREFPIDATDDDGEEPERPFDDALSGTAGMSSDEMLAELARVLAQGITSGWRGMPGSFLDLAAPTVSFDADTYFDELTKPYLDLVWRDMADIETKIGLKGKTSEVLAKVKQRAAQTGWLPPQLRTPSYAGPSMLSQVEAEESDDDDADDDDADEDEALQAAE